MITSTSMGPNSVNISYTAGESMANIFAAMETFLLASGWVVHDANAVNVVTGSLTAKCYKALCADGVTYKYMTIGWSAVDNMVLNVFESWNATAHTYTNMAYPLGHTSGLPATNYQPAQRMSTATGGNMYVFASPRYCAILGKNSAGAFGANDNAGDAISGATGCFEIARDNAEDTAALGYPPFVWIHTSAFMQTTRGNFATSYGATVTNGFGGCFSPCRTRNGNVGQIAAQHTMVSTPFGSHGVMNGTSLTQYTVNATQYTVPGLFYPNANNVWSSKGFAATPIAIMDTQNFNSAAQSPDIRGRIFGIKITTAGRGAYLDTTNVKVDADGFTDNGGTLAAHYIIPASGYYGVGPRVALPA